MNTPHNPYAPPQASLEEGVIGEEIIYRKGKVLVLPLDSALPHRCVKCNAPTASPMKSRTLYWHHPGIFALLLFNVLFYLIGALIARKKAQVAPSLCAVHKRKRLLYLSFSGLIALLGVGMLIGAINYDSNNAPVVASLGILLILVAILTSILGGRIVYASRITPEHLHLKGCGEDFLASFKTATAAPAPSKTPRL